ncbi:hypothetical protein SAMN05216486_10173 [bacterium JGI 053]|nr:hypothetical protein SAMN05216486_10173 [bacterium JGI 053]
MGLFGRHDYGRDYRGGGRGFGDRLRGAWNRFEHRTEGGMHRGYDQGMRGGSGGYDASDFAYRGLEGAWSTARNRGAHDVQWDWRRAGGSPYDQDVARGGGYDRQYATFRPTGGGGYPAGRPGYGRPDRYDVSYRGWNGGVGDEPGYQGRDFGGWGRGRR